MYVSEVGGGEKREGEVHEKRNLTIRPDAKVIF